MGDVTKFPDRNSKKDNKSQNIQPLREFLLKVFDTLDKYQGIPTDQKEVFSGEDGQILFLFSGNHMMPVSNTPPTRKMLGNIANWCMAEHDRLLEEEQEES